MKVVYFNIIWLVMIPFSAMSDVYVRQINNQMLVTDKTVCFALTNFTIPIEGTLAYKDWTEVRKTANDYNWVKLDPALCEFKWKVKYNIRNTTLGMEGYRPIKDIQTGKYTGKYIAPGEPCGERASLNYSEHWRIVPGGMAYCG